MNKQEPFFSSIMETEFTVLWAYPQDRAGIRSIPYSNILKQMYYKYM